MRFFPGENFILVSYSLMCLLLLSVVVLLFPVEFSGYRKSDASAPVWYFITETGNIKYFLALMVFVILVLVFTGVFKRKNFKKLIYFFMIMFACQLALTGTVHFLLKDKFRKPRPSQTFLLEKTMNENEKIQYYAMPAESAKIFLSQKIKVNPEKFPDIHPLTFKTWLKEDNYSFPSGHAQLSFFTGVIFSFLILNSVSQRQKYLSVLPLIWALLVSLSRVVIGVHYPSDVITGALIGFIGAMIILSFKNIRNLITQN